MAFVNEKNEYPTPSRTIDYERNAYLRNIKTCQRDQQPDEFELYWNDEKIKFKAQEHVYEGGTVRWIVVSISTPNNLSSQINEIKSLITDSLSQYGIRYSLRLVDKVEVIFSKRLNEGVK